MPTTALVLGSIVGLFALLGLTEALSRVEEMWSTRVATAVALVLIVACLIGAALL